MSEPQSVPDARDAAAVLRRLKPAPLLFEPEEAVEDTEHFFDLESIEDPQQLLTRSTELAVAFREAADRATEFQAVAAAQLADPQRFDRMTPAVIAERAGWSEDYAQRMVDFGRDLLSGASGD
jgi:HJR/Mrr/RecB family endonuclease